MTLSRGRHNSFVRRLAMTLIDVALLRGLVAQWTWRWGWHGDLKVTRHEISLTDNKRLPTPLTMAFASDFHAGPTTNPQVFASLLQELCVCRPEILLLGGDYVSLRSSYLTELTDALKQYSPPFGTFAVLGNHDLWSGDTEIARGLSDLGVEVLMNRNVALRAPFDSVSICGFDDPWTGSADSRQTFQGSRPIRIWLTHSPDGLLLLDGHQYSVGFAGHTHGGQICLRNGTPLVGAGGPLSRSHSRRRFDVAGNGPLIVSRGIGCSNLPVRINSDLELIICRLQ
jgi:predicted MPP superfamily phosphohydrolase